LKETNKSIRPCSDKKNINNIKSFSNESHSGPNTCPIHQAAASLLPPPLPGVLTSLQGRKTMHTTIQTSERVS